MYILYRNIVNVEFETNICDVFQCVSIFLHVPKAAITFSCYIRKWKLDYLLGLEERNIITTTERMSFVLHCTKNTFNSGSGMYLSHDTIPYNELFFYVYVPC